MALDGMKNQQYQLVLQFPCHSMAAFDTIVELENDLIAEFSDSSADVDGHDFGSGEANIFIFTSEPKIAFERAHAVIGKDAHLAATLRAAYRHTGAEEFCVLWPVGHVAFAVA